MQLKVAIINSDLITENLHAMVSANVHLGTSWLTSNTGKKDRHMMLLSIVIRYEPSKDRCVVLQSTYRAVTQEQTIDNIE